MPCDVPRASNSFHILERVLSPFLSRCAALHIVNTQVVHLFSASNRIGCRIFGEVTIREVVVDDLSKEVFPLLQAVRTNVGGGQYQ